MRKTVDPPSRMREFRFSENEFKALLGIGGGDVVRVSCGYRETEIAMDLNPDGTRDRWFIDTEEFRSKLGLPADYRPSSVYIELTFPMCRRVISITAFPK